MDYFTPVKVGWIRPINKPTYDHHRYDHEPSRTPDRRGPSFWMGWFVGLSSHKSMAYHDGCTPN